MSSLIRKFNIWPLPRAAKQFNRLEREEQLEKIAEHVQEFHRPLTAYIFFEDMCVVVEYGKDRGVQIVPMKVYAVSKDEGMYKVKNTSGTKYMWHYLQPNSKTKKTYHHANV